MILILVLTVLAGEKAAFFNPVMYGHDFSTHSAAIQEQPINFPADMPLAEPEYSVSPYKRYRAKRIEPVTEYSNHGDRVASIEVQRYSGEKSYIQLKDFRVIEMRWLNDRLLYIHANIGHVASMEYIYDAEVGEWIYSESVIYSTQYQYPVTAAWE